MSENLDLVRSIFASWERGDFSSAEWADPDIEYVMADGPMPGSWTGLADMAVAMRDLLDAWENYRVEADDFREIDDERVLVILHARGRGKTSRLELDETAGAGRGANLFHVRDGNVVKLLVYWDRDRALADLGLEK